jgi:O-antigen/teichoic acid export membrane protein
LTDPAAEALEDLSTKRRAAAGAVMLVARGLGVRLVFLLALVVVARVLGPSDFGVAAFAVTLLPVLDVIAGAGLGAALIRASHEPTPEQLRAILGFQLSLSLVLVACFVGVAAVTGWGELMGVLALTSCAIPLAAGRVPGMVLTERRLAYRPIVYAEITETLVFAGISISLVLAGVGPVAVAIAAVVRKAVGTIIVCALVPAGRVGPSLRFGPALAILPFGVRVQAAALIDTGRDQLLNVGIAAVGGLAAVGLWSAAYRLFQIPLLLLQALWQVSFAASARLLNEELAGVGPAAAKAVGMVAIPLGAVLTVLVAAGPEPIALLLGREWEEAYALVPLGALGILVNGPISVASAGVLFAVGQPGQVLRAIASSAVVFVVGAVALYGPLGLFGVSVAWLLASLVEAGLLARDTRRAVTIDLLPSLRPALTGAVTVWPLAVVPHLGTPAPLWAGLLAAGVTPALYVAVLFVARPVLLKQTFSTAARALRDTRAS